MNHYPKPDALYRLIDLAPTMHANSCRWFPHVHAAGSARVHFALGLAGELGEVIEAACKVEYSATELALELADLATYALNLWHEEGYALDELAKPSNPPVVFTTRPTETLAIAVGRVVEIVKKMHRSDAYPPTLDLRLRQALGELLWKVLDFAGPANLFEAIATKQAVCEERWGNPDPFPCSHPSLSGVLLDGELLWECHSCSNVLREVESGYETVGGIRRG